jgi:hypothetical protein
MIKRDPCNTELNVFFVSLWLDRMNHVFFKKSKLIHEMISLVKINLYKKSQMMFCYFKFNQSRNKNCAKWNQELCYSMSMAFEWYSQQSFIDFMFCFNVKAFTLHKESSSTLPSFMYVHRHSFKYWNPPQKAILSQIQEVCLPPLNTTTNHYHNYHILIF